MYDEESSRTEIAKEVLETILENMGISASVEYQAGDFIEDEESETPVILDIKGEDLGILIGRRGQTLACLQYIVRLIVTQKVKIHTPIVIDVEGYKQRRYLALQSLAQRIAEQVASRNTPFTLEPMPAYERRIIHLTLAEHSGVTTESTGAGEMRKVVILPKKQY
jgi:spoIIIJ-associated protein